MKIRKNLFFYYMSISFHATAYLGGLLLFNRYFFKKIIVSGLLLAFIL
jgi:hypothetical protein